jgi:hypothetical protein
MGHEINKDPIYSTCWWCVPCGSVLSLLRTNLLMSSISVSPRLGSSGSAGQSYQKETCNLLFKEEHFLVAKLSQKLIL